jgi:hypothetical protein
LGREVARVGVEVARVDGGLDDDDDVLCGGGVDFDFDLDFFGVEASMAILDLHIG